MGIEEAYQQREHDISDRVAKLIVSEKQCQQRCAELLKKQAEECKTIRRDIIYQANTTRQKADRFAAKKMDCMKQEIHAHQDKMKKYRASYEAAMEQEMQAHHKSMHVERSSHDGDNAKTAGRSCILKNRLVQRKRTHR